MASDPSVYILVRMLNQNSPVANSTEDDAVPGSVAGPTMSHLGLRDVDPWDDSAPTRRRVLKRGLRGATEVLEIVALALIMFMGVRTVVHNYVVDGDSMVPTFTDGQLIIVNRMAYRNFDLSWIPGMDREEWRPFGTPERGDIIVFTYQRNPPRDFIKRVIGVPGDEVEVRDGYVYVNGEPLDEPYIAEQALRDHPPEVVPDGHVFVMGDNRNNSLDSRTFRSIDESQIIGRAEIRYWPLNEAWLIDHQLGPPLRDQPPSPSSMSP